MSLIDQHRTQQRVDTMSKSIFLFFFFKVEWWNFHNEVSILNDRNNGQRLATFLFSTAMRMRRKTVVLTQLRLECTHQVHQLFPWQLAQYSVHLVTTNSGRLATASTSSFYTAPKRIQFIDQIHRNFLPTSITLTVYLINFPPRILHHLNLIDHQYAIKKPPQLQYICHFLQDIFHN